MNGLQSEGIFRVPGDAEEVTDLVCWLHWQQLPHIYWWSWIACSDWKWQLWCNWHYWSQRTCFFAQILASWSWKTINTHWIVWWMRQVCREFWWSHRHCQCFTRSQSPYCHVHDCFCTGKLFIYLIGFMTTHDVIRNSIEMKWHNTRAWMSTILPWCLLPTFYDVHLIHWQPCSKTQSTNKPLSEHWSQTCRLTRIHAPMVMKLPWPKRRIWMISF